MIITENLNSEFAGARAQVPQPDRRTYTRAPQAVLVPSGQMGRTAQIGGESVRLGADIRNLAPPIKDPRFNPDNFFIPHYDPSNGTTNPTLHEWIIHYYKYDPLVGNAIEIHSQLPISRFDITGVEDPAIMQVYEQMVDDINLLDNMYNFLKCWWLFGEAMPYFWWSEAYNRFVQMTFIDTSRVRVLGHHLGFSELGDSIYHYELEPDEHLKNLVNSNDPYDREVAQYIDPAIVGAIRRGMNLELDPFSTELVCNKAVPWDLRGTSIILGIIKDLLYSDTLKNAQYAIARGHIAPRWLWKLGQAGPDGYMPTDTDLQNFRELLLQANQDPLFTIITHYAISAEVIGSAGKVLPIASELEGIDRRIMTRLFTNKALTYSEGPTYSSASVGLRVLMSRYLPIRSMMEDLFKRKLFLPVALANGFVDKDNKPIIPNFNWRHKQSLLDDSAMRSALLQLRDKGDVPLKVLADGMELDYEELLHWLDEEQGTIADRTMYQGKVSAIQKMIQGATKGIAGLLESFRALRLPKDKAEGETEDEGKDVPDGYDPDLIEDVKLPSDRSTGTPSTPVSKSPTDKPQAPLGGEAGEKTTQSFRQFKNRKRATKPPRFQSMRAKATYAGVMEADSMPLNEWQQRLLTTKIDKSSQQTIIDTEVNVLNSFESAQKLFVDRLLMTWKEKGSIQDKDLSHAVRETVDVVNAESGAGFGEQLTTLYEGAQAVAVDKLTRSKKGRRYLNQRRASLSDDRKRQIEDAVSKAFAKINTVSDDMLEKMRTKLHDNVDDIPTNIVNQLFAEVDAEGLINLTDDEVRDRLGELWNKQRYIYERIIRTETMNIYVTGGLQEWSDAGYKKAVRREMNDNKVCAYCRTVDGKEYDIDKLLLLDYPLIQNPDTGEYEGHPYCFMGPKVPVETVGGEKRLIDIKVGDLVLTHKGRFRPVEELHRHVVPVGTESIEIKFTRTFGNKEVKFAKFSVTKEHPILTDRGWVRAEHIKAGDVVVSRGAYCVECGKVIPYNSKVDAGTPQCFECIHKLIGVAVKDKFNDPEWVARWNANHLKAVSSPAFRKKVSETNKRIFNTPEMREKCRQNAINQMKRENRKKNWPIEKRRAQIANLRAKLTADGYYKVQCAINLRKGQSEITRVSKPQVRLFNFMKYNFGDDVVMEHRIVTKSGRVRFADVALPDHKIDIEYDGSYWHKDKDADGVRDRELQESGWNVIRTEDGNSFVNVLGDVHRLMANHAEEYAFSTARVESVRIKRIKCRRRVYNLTVKDDNSFIVMGIVTHNCRGSFSPIVSFSEFDEYIPPPEVAFDDVEPVFVGDTEINGVPTVMADQIESALEYNDLSAVINVVPDVVDTLAWVDAERQKILQDELGQGRTPPSGMRLDLMVNESQENNRGAVSLFETDTGETLVSGFSFFGAEPEWFILRQRGKQDYSELPADLVDTIGEMYAMKMAESEMSIDDDGVEIIGVPVGGRAVGFITPTASQDAENYFIESFSFYQTDPYKLEFLDPLMYTFLRDSVYNGVQFKQIVDNSEE